MYAPYLKLVTSLTDAGQSNQHFHLHYHPYAIWPLSLSLYQQPADCCDLINQQSYIVSTSGKKMQRVYHYPGVSAAFSAHSIIIADECKDCLDTWTCDEVCNQIHVMCWYNQIRPWRAYLSHTTHQAVIYFCTSQWWMTSICSCPLSSSSPCCLQLT